MSAFETGPRVLEKEDVTVAFGVPGAAINPLYAVLRQRRKIRHILARLAFDKINNEQMEGYGVDHVTVAEGLGCKAIRVRSPNEFEEAFARARALMEEHQAGGA
jgi:glyoxylate carboligase